MWAPNHLAGGGHAALKLKLEGLRSARHLWRLAQPMPSLRPRRVAGAVRTRRGLLNVGLSKHKQRLASEVVRAAPAPSRDEWWGRDAGSSAETRVVLGPSDSLREKRATTPSDLPELLELDKFAAQLKNKDLPPPAGTLTLDDVGMSKEQCRDILAAGMATMVLHSESRVASALGEGFYTIGPCGEELMACVGLQLRDSDSMALHYRHLATQIARSLKTKTMDEVLLDRARGHVVSQHDPVGGGVHCSLGGGLKDFVVTSTLASQAPPAVGRAIGAGLAQYLGLQSKADKNSVSFVSVGDGSVNNAHFLTAINMAEYAKYRSFKCPTVFAVTDNELCISLKGHGWFRNEFVNKLAMPVFEASGMDLPSLWKATADSIAWSRKNQAPSMLVVHSVPRRFGHAATDRQSAYLTQAEITALSETNPMAGACAFAVQQGAATYDELHAMLSEVREQTRAAFDSAATEPKITSRQALMDMNSQPLVDMPPAPAPDSAAGKARAKRAGAKPQVMRKNMTSVIQEILEENDDAVYIGEDVEHGGYYLVTEHLAKKFPQRVRDFPPDETALLAMGQGFAHAGMVPIVEIPYAKYLDCGFDMFNEIAISNWLSGGRQPNGMIIRLQGFDKGVFGGNFHTHNQLYVPPGIDVVCYSNGYDYARGWRYAFEQARAGRVIMSVDSTNLLNTRHIFDADDKWKRQYPGEAEALAFDDVIVYGGNSTDTCTEGGNQLGIVTYGNGVMTALHARQYLKESYGLNDVVIIDTPYLNSVSNGLRHAVKNLDAVVFADVCKQGLHPLAGIVCELQNDGLLPRKWQCVAATPTYNPLGSTVTFTSIEDVMEAALTALSIDETSV